MKEKTKSKKMKQKGFKASGDMQQILQDSRFAHVPFDPKLRQLPKKERKVNIDSRFSSMFTDEKFHEKSTMDPRGRKGNFSTKEDLRKFYHLSSDEADSDDDDESDSHEKEPEDTDEEEEKENEVSDEKEEEKDNVSEEAGDSQSKKDKEDRAKEIEELLQDVTQDYARGVMIFSDDSSDDDSSSDEEEEEVEFEWGELDQDAVWDDEQDFEETSRIAVCNLDWDNIKAMDVMVVFNSFCPRGGSVKKVTIYPSEFGKQRMAEEDQFGPKELTNQKSDNADADVDMEKLEKGKLDSRSSSKNDSEALRRYERNRLRYYYAVVECDSVETSMTIYKDCDRQSFERAGVLMDLRYIPDDMTFDEVPHDVCDTVPEFYEPKLFVTTALIDTRPTLTWDQTDPHRQKVLSDVMKDAASGKDINDEYLKNLIASSSESEDELDDEEGDFSSDEDEDAKLSRIAKFRALIQEIDKKEKKKSDPFDMEEDFGGEGGDGDEKNFEDEEAKKADLTPFEKYLEKRKAKRQERMKKKKMEAEGQEDSGDENRNVSADISDDELPEDIYKDPFFAEEMDKRPKKGGKEKKKKKKSGNEAAKELNQGDLELLLMDEDKEEKKHFSMRDIIDEHKGKSKKKLKKKAKLKMEEKMKAKNAAVDDFKIDTSDSRFSNLLQSNDYNIDPSHPQYKRTKAMDVLISDVQNKRIAESFEDMPNAKRIDTGKGREEHELSMLVKRVKSKTNKPKKS